MTEVYREKVIPSVVTAIVISIVFFAMQQLTLPQKNIAEIYRKFDESVWKQFEPPEIKKEEPEPEPEKIEPEEIVEEVVEPEQVMEELDQVFEEELSILDDMPLEELTMEQSELGLDDIMDNDMLESSVDELPGLGLDEYGEDDVPLVPMSSGAGGDDALTSEASGKGGIGIRGYSGGTGTDKIKGKKRIENEVTIDLKAGRSLSNLDLQNKVYKELVQWLRKNQKTLRPVVRAFLGYSETRGALTTKAMLKSGGRSFELYILCIEKGTELRIALVEGKKVIRLVDQGFSMRSEQLRTGFVSRDETGKIFRFGTRLQPTGSKANKEFYEIFKTWWVSQKK